MYFPDRVYRIDRINSSCESCYPVHIYMERLPRVTADLFHWYTSLNLPIEIEPGRIRLKIAGRKGGVRKGTADEGG